MCLGLHKVVYIYIIAHIPGLGFEYIQLISDKLAGIFIEISDENL